MKSNAKKMKRPEKRSSSTSKKQMAKSPSLLRPILIYHLRFYILHPTFYSDIRCMQTNPTTKHSAESVGSRDPTLIRDVKCCRNV